MSAAAGCAAARGSVSLLVVIMVPALLMAAGLVLDGGRQLQARRDAGAAAAAAARAASQLTEQEIYGARPRSRAGRQPGRRRAGGPGSDAARWRSPARRRHRHRHRRRRLPDPARRRGPCRRRRARRRSAACRSGSRAVSDGPPDARRRVGRRVWLATASSSSSACPCCSSLLVGNPWPGLEPRRAARRGGRSSSACWPCSPGSSGCASWSPSSSRCAPSSPSCAGRRRTGAGAGPARRARRARRPVSGCSPSASSPPILVARCPLAARVAPAVAAGPAPLRSGAADAVAGRRCRPAPTRPSQPAPAAPASGVGHGRAGRHADRAGPQHLGDAARWREIFELNRDRPQVDGGRLSARARSAPAGRLVLPADASVAGARRSRRPTAAPLPRAGDGRRSSSTTRCGTSPTTAWPRAGLPTTTSRVADYVHAVVDANADVVEDPDLIFVGEQFTFPAVGTPPVDRPAAGAAPTAGTSRPHRQPPDDGARRGTGRVAAGAGRPGAGRRPRHRDADDHDDDRRRLAPVDGAAPDDRRPRRLAVTDRRRRGRAAVGRRAGAARRPPPAPAARLAAAGPGARAAARGGRRRAPAARRRRRRAAAARRHRRAGRGRVARRGTGAQIAVVRSASTAPSSSCSPPTPRCRRRGRATADGGRCPARRRSSCSPRPPAPSAPRAWRWPSSASTPTVARCSSTSRRSACWRSTHPTALADAVVRGIAATLATSIFAEVANLVGVGIDGRRLPRPPPRPPVATVDDALELAATLVGTTASADAESTFVLRARHTSGEAWEPAIVLVGSAVAGEVTPRRRPLGRPAARRSGPRRRPATCPARRGRCAPTDGRWTLEPLGIDARARSG